ncbi:MAG: zinc-dependent peptidase [Planctomycetales bacterium]|nr:zinc-dependent peptidase [Planctomycetales bacterium]
MFGSWFRGRRRRALLAADFSDAWEQTLRSTVRQFPQLSVERQRRVRQIVQVFVAEKDWVGAGTEVTDEMRVTVAGHAGLMACGYDEPYFYDKLATVIIYPRTIRFDPERVERYTALPDFPAEGVAFQRGPVLLSWATVRRELAGRAPGRNVILHELAHHVDGLLDDMDGTPAWSDRRRAAKWQEVAEREFLQLAGSARRREPTLLDHYGATNRAEFFAVATECFFELPQAMRRRHGELYELLAGFYQLDPAEWFAPAAFAEQQGAEPTPRRVHRRPHGRPAGGAAGETVDAQIIAQRHAELLRQRDQTRLRALSSMTEADALYTLALGHLDARPPRAADAERIFSQLLQGNPADEEALAHRGLARWMQGNVVGAQADCDAALAIDPVDVDALEVRARLSLAERRWPAALADVQLALRELPQDADLLALRGDAHAGLQQWSRALNDYSDAVAYDPYHAAALRGRAVAHDALGFRQRAAADRRRAESIEPTK